MDKRGSDAKLGFLGKPGSTWPALQIGIRPQAPESRKDAGEKKDFRCLSRKPGGKWPFGAQGRIARQSTLRGRVGEEA